MYPFCSEAAAIHSFFFIPAKKTTILDLHLLNWSDGTRAFWSDLNCTATPSQESLISLKKKGGREEELTVSFVSSCIDSE